MFQLLVAAQAADQAAEVAYDAWFRETHLQGRDGAAAKSVWEAAREVAAAAWRRYYAQQEAAAQRALYGNW